MTTFLTTLMLLQQQPGPPAVEIFRRRGPTDNTVGILVPIAFFVLIGFIIWLRIRQRQQHIQTHAELRKQLLDKFSSGRELTEFLETPGGQRFVEDLRSHSLGHRHRVIGSVRAGIILVTLGVALLTLSWLRASAPGPHHGYMVGGVIVLALGAGNLISSVIAYRIARRWSHDAEPGQPGPSAPAL